MPPPPSPSCSEALRLLLVQSEANILIDHELLNICIQPSYSSYSDLVLWLTYCMKFFLCANMSKMLGAVSPSPLTLPYCHFY